MQEKFDWLPTESAPELYPMNIHSGNLYFEDGESVYIPCSGSANNGWGKTGSIHLQGNKLRPVPVKLEVTLASFKENKFYTGAWDLPKEKILKLFKEGFVYYDTRKKQTYSKINVGCAPGGIVVVWLSGVGNQVEIGRYQAHDTLIAMSDYLPGNPTAIQKEAFANLGKLDDQLEKIYEKKGGIQFGLWDTYRKKYNWKAKIEIAGHKFEKIGLKMFNGEAENLFDEVLLKNEFKERAIPSYMSFMIANVKGVKTVFEFKEIDEEEIFDLFKKSDISQPIEIILRMNEDLTNRRLIFKQGSKELTIAKIDVNNTWEYDR
ncbi:hypothetical protein HNQ02_003784 [Flavobacterium sp. 7E]|uniref:DUF2931 family protein n=1 Tax=Flavobacterium sp. 7E TaxID=2735898 RepID=UPI0020C64627|nr:DUF2931 family protein [Flavobacterium sp. 7E]NRS90837.1 hypothetical protein [Flavobacterium sp. 7E]